MYNRISVSAELVRIFFNYTHANRRQQYRYSNNYASCDCYYILGRRHTKQQYMHSGTRVIIITRLRHRVYNVSIQIVYYTVLGRRTSHARYLYCQI